MTAHDTKGIREYQAIVTYFLALDRKRGVSFNKLAKLYRLDKNNIQKRIKKYNETTQSHNR